MPYLDKTAKTDEYIILPNPDHSLSDFRRNNKGDINITGNTNHGAGVKARRGLLRGSGKSEDIDYLFDTSKFTEETAREWLDNYKEKSIMKNGFLNKNFAFTMPLIKGYDGDDGYYHIKFAISTAQPDLQNDQMTDNALESMLNQIKGLNVKGNELKGINIDDSHQKGLKSIIGPVTDGWIDESKQLWVDLRVREEWEKTIRDLEDSGSYLGGSIYGKGTAFLEDDGTGITKIDDVFLMRAALTDTPAAWDTRRAADVSKACPMCTQIMKSLESNILEDNNVKKSVINVEEAYEVIRGDINEALDKKYGQMMEGGWIDRKCYLRYTMPDSIVISTYSGDLYQIPYTRDTSMEDEVQLGDPVPATNQIVTKMIEKAAWILKSDKPNGGGNLTKVDETIPEGMDEKFVDKVKALGEDGKKYLKSILGLEDTGDPAGEPGGNPNPSTGDAQVNKTMMSKDDVQKMLDAQKEDIKKDFEAERKEDKEKIQSLEKTVGKREDTISKQEHDDLVTKALKKTQDLGIEEVKDEETLMKHLQEKEDFTEEELKEDPDACIKTAIRIWKGASKYIPAGKLPRTDENEMQKMADKHAENAKEIRKNLAKRGTK